MRWFYFSFLLLFVVICGGFGFISHTNQGLNDLCQRLTSGQSVAEVRDLATQSGFETKMEAFIQMKIEPPFWEPLTPSCKVFFNRNQTVEYRVWQSS